MSEGGISGDQKPVTPVGETSPSEVKVVTGAFEVYEGTTEQLEIETDLVDEETGEGRLLRVGDVIQVPGLDLSGNAVGIAINDPNTERCQTQMLDLGKLQRENPDTPMFILTMKGLDDDHKSFNFDIPMTEIDVETARKLALRIIPGQDADPGAWAGTLRRTALSTVDGAVAHVEQIDDQFELPDAGKALEALQKTS